MDMNEVLETIKNRRSIRKYKPEQIKDDELKMILEAGMYAPTAHNEQPWHFTVVQNSDVLRHINTVVQADMAKSDVEWIRNMGSNPAFSVTYQAPTLIVVSGRADALAMQADCAASIENMLIAAESLGIGSVWLGLTRYLFARGDEVAKLGLPVGYKPYYSVALGYAAIERRPIAPKRNKDVVNYIR